MINVTIPTKKELLDFLRNYLPENSDFFTDYALINSKKSHYLFVKDASGFNICALHEVPSEKVVDLFHFDANRVTIKGVGAILYAPLSMTVFTSCCLVIRNIKDLPLENSLHYRNLKSLPPVFYYGEYPQFKVSDELSKILENEYNNGTLLKTGKVYNGTISKEYPNEKNKHIEYIFNNKKYIRIKGTWIEVSLIDWYLSENKKYYISRPIVSCFMPYEKRDGLFPSLKISKDNFKILENDMFGYEKSQEEINRLISENAIVQMIMHNEGIKETDITINEKGEFTLKRKIYTRND